MYIYIYICICPAQENPSCQKEARRPAAASFVLITFIIKHRHHPSINIKVSAIHVIKQIVIKTRRGLFRLRTSMCVHVYMCVYICVCVYIYIYIYICTYTYVYVCKYVISLSLSLPLSVYICVYIHIYIYI